MPEARDRRPSTPLQVATAFARRRAQIFILPDPDPITLRSPPRNSIFGSGGFRAQRNSIGRGGRDRFLHAPGPENIPSSSLRRVRGRGSLRTLLPSWYPRTPLRDITSVVRAIERRRARLGDTEGQQTGTPFPVFPDPSGANFEDTASVSSPSSVSKKLRTPAGSKLPKILLDITSQPEGGESELLTPQKKLLNSIDKVEKVVQEELQKLKRTPSAKKAAREKRVRTLMSMR